MQLGYEYMSAGMQDVQNTANGARTAGPHSQGSATPHSHSENRMGRPVAFSASRIALYLPTRCSELVAKSVARRADSQTAWDMTLVM